MPFYVTATFNPAIVFTRKDPNTRAAIGSHFGIAHAILTGQHGSTADVSSTEPGPPPPQAGLCLSLDIETYGAAYRDWNGRRLPEQNHFNPVRSLTQDRVRPSSLVLTVSLTLCDSPFSGPGTTRVFRLNDARHRIWLAAWLRSASTLVGLNLPFDVMYLRAVGYPISPETHRLIDLSVLNYLHAENRPERSLKAMSNLFGTHVYDDEVRDLGHHRFPNPTDPNPKGLTLSVYNAQDTHISAVNAQILADAIESDYPGSPKLADENLARYSDLLWDCIGLQETGVSYSYPALRSLEVHLRRRMARCERLARERYDLVISGPGSAKSKDEFMGRCLEAAPHVADDPRLKLTEKQRKVSADDQNRNLFRLELPADSPLLPALRLFDRHGRAQKILGTFVYPLLYHQKTKPKERRGLAISSKPWVRPRSPEQIAKRTKSKPDHPDVLAAYAAQEFVCPTRAITTYPSWYPVPSSDEGNAEEFGGTQQGRITARHHSVQTDPPELQKCYCSRWPLGVIVGIDLSQIELRVAGLLSGEPSIVDAYVEGRDLHWERAEAIFPDLASEFGEDYRSNKTANRERRQPSKTFNFGDLFLAQAKTLQIQILKMTGRYIPIEVCERAVSSRSTVRPVLSAWQQMMIDRACAEHVIMLPITGQSRQFLGDPRTVRETYASTIVNFPVQTTAANILLEISREMRRRLPHWTRPGAWCVPIANKYDALYFDVRFPHLVDDLLTSWSGAIQEVTERGYYARLCDHYGRRVPIEYEASV